MVAFKAILFCFLVALGASFLPQPVIFFSEWIEKIARTERLNDLRRGRKLMLVAKLVAILAFPAAIGGGWGVVLLLPKVGLEFPLMASDKQVTLQRQTELEQHQLKVEKLTQQIELLKNQKLDTEKSIHELKSALQNQSKERDNEQLNRNAQYAAAIISGIFGVVGCILGALISHFLMPRNY